MCPTRHLCGSIEDAIFTDDSECAAFNKSVADMPDAEIPAVQRWIPVTERMPELDTLVLVIAHGKPCSNVTLVGACELAYYSEDGGWIFESWPEWEYPEVTYWMPFYEPPKEEL